ncbi:MAG TPA: SRPBCC family protein [Candidatus Thermoplasmatota archaeon]|nr:SRPBCC family protein [Candidatus Thermoplasmatota archaeon]
MMFEVACEVAAPLEGVWAWWTDFGSPGDELRVSHGLGASRRRVLEAAPGRVVFEDRTPLGTVRRTVRLQPGHRFLETGEGAQSFESEWRFEATPAGGTRVTRSMRVRAAAALRPAARLVTWMDLRHHCREAERDLRGSRGA